MKRREVIAGVGSLAALGAGAYAVFGRPGQSTGDQIDPVPIDTLDVAGSPGTEIQVPFEGSVTVVDLFATTCAACPDHIDTLAAAREQLDADVRFVSVTNQIVDDRQPRSYFRDWWQTHGADWPVGFDDDGTLTEAFDVPARPFTGIVAPDLTIAWAKAGQTEADTVVDQIQRVLESGE